MHSFAELFDRIGLRCSLSPGKIDATVEVKIDRRPKIRRHRPDTANQVQAKVLPLELKTGKMFTKLGKNKKELLSLKLLEGRAECCETKTGVITLPNHKPHAIH